MIETAELECPDELEARAVHLDCGDEKCHDCPWVMFITEAGEDMWAIFRGVFDFKPEEVQMDDGVLDASIRKSIIFGQPWEQVFAEPAAMALRQGLAMRSASQAVLDEAMSMPLSELRECAVMADQIIHGMTRGERIRQRVLRELPGASRN